MDSDLVLYLPIAADSKHAAELVVPLTAASIAGSVVWAFVLFIRTRVDCWVLLLSTPTDFGRLTEDKEVDRSLRGLEQD